VRAPVSALTIISHLLVTFELERMTFTVYVITDYKGQKIAFEGSDQVKTTK